jgi:hypothetical protein
MNVSAYAGKLPDIYLYITHSNSLPCFINRRGKINANAVAGKIAQYHLPVKGEEGSNTIGTPS